MNASDEYYMATDEVSDSWTQSVTDDLERSNRRAWIVAAGFAAIAVLEAVALVYLTPLKTVEPYTLLVDRQTGHVEALAPLDAQIVAPDTALTRSFLVQYVIAREGFDVDSVQDDYRKVSLWSQGQERQRYANRMQKGNPLNPLSYMPRNGIIRTQVRSISSLSATRSLIRFTTTRLDASGRARPPEYWASVVDYDFTSAEMSEADRLVNPLGFQVTRYRRSAETLPEADTALEPNLPSDRVNGPTG